MTFCDLWEHGRFYEKIKKVTINDLLGQISLYKIDAFYKVSIYQHLFRSECDKKSLDNFLDKVTEFFAFRYRRAYGL